MLVVESDDACCCFAQKTLGYFQYYGEAETVVIAQRERKERLMM